MRGRGKITRYVLLACMVLACSPCVFALNPDLEISQYSHTSWTVRDGFFKSGIGSIAQTPDGYLWLGTQFGLLRFDGVKVTEWQPPLNQHLPSTYIFSLLAARDGTLWIGTLKGLTSWKDGKLTEYPELAGKYVVNMLEDHEGTVWASGRIATGGKLCAFQRGTMQCYGEDGTLGRGAVSLYEDRKGNLWAGVSDGLWRWKPGPPKFYPLAGEPDGIQAICEDNNGTLLIGWHGLQRFVDGKTEPFSLPSTVGQFHAKRLFRDRNGGVWIGTTQMGLIHVHRGNTDVFARSDGLSGDSVPNIFEDREDNIWVGTSSGLDRFRDFAVATLNTTQGLSNAAVSAVLGASDGSVWLATHDGLNRLHDGQLTVYRGALKGTTTKAHEIFGSGLPDQELTSLFQDGRGRIWIATLHGVGYLENDRFISVPGLLGGNILSIAEDTGGSLWIDNEQLSLYQLLGGRDVRQIPWTALGHKEHASTLISDPLHGGLWVGFHLGGLAYFSDNQVLTSFTATDGLGAGRVNHLRFDNDGALWASTEGGLSRLKNGQIVTLTSKNGLPCDTVHWSMEDNARDLWMYSACGLLRIARADLDAWVAAVDKDIDTKQSVHATVFNSSDGVRSLALAGHYSPQVAKSSDGRLWFLPWDGASVIDPAHIPFNQVPPPVNIEQITADRKSYEVSSFANGQMRLPPLIRDLQIDYTALSLVVPEKVLFRYKLENYDRDWHDAGNRRVAFYTNLPPGNYRFRVMACNNSGVWNEAGTFLDFAIAPAYYQTLWFRLLLLVVFLSVLILAYRLRVKQVTQRLSGRMEARVEERERIARDLHDTLLQSVQGLILKFHAVSKQLPQEEVAHDALEQVLDRADEVLAEARDRVRNLRSATEIPRDLPAALKRVAEEHTDGRETIFKTVVEGRARPLHPLVFEETYSIGREAITNALKHSQGHHIEAEILYEPRHFRLRVRDDGRGFDPKIFHDGASPDHFGLRGIRERAQRIGAQVSLWSGPDTGTEVELVVPGATAYSSPDQKPRRFWSRLS
jgi:signal transduction histidine kinase/ligand-binding sensor domain-containing protein